MEVIQYARAVSRWAWLIMLGGALGGLVALLVTTRMVPTYEASTRLLVHETPASGAYDPLFPSSNLPLTIGELLRTRVVLEAVITQLQLGISTETLRKHVTVTVSRDSPLIVVTAEDRDPRRAADIANEIVKVFGEQSRELQAKRYVTSIQNTQDEMEKTLADVASTQALLGEVRAKIISSGGVVEPGQIPVSDDAQAAASRSGAVATPEQMAEQSRLQTLLSQFQTSYQGLSQSLQKVRLAALQQSDNLLVIESAQPMADPAWPRPLLNTFLGVIIGVLMAAGGVFLTERSNKMQKSGEEVGPTSDVLTQDVGVYIDESDPSDEPDCTTGSMSAIATARRILELQREMDRLL